MNCYVCQQQGREQTAVAVCTHCGAALCQEHFAERQTYRVGGMNYLLCNHIRPVAPASAR